MNLEYLKTIAYILSRAILLPPAEVSSTLDDKPKSLQNKSVKQIVEFDSNDLKYLSKLFMGDSYSRSFLEGFWGTGIGRLEDGKKCILVYASKDTLKKLSKGLEFAELKTDCKIRGYEIDCIQAASCNLPAFSTGCPGGACIMPWNGSSVGTLGAWLRLANPRGVVVGITNNHVAIECNKHSHGKSIVHPKANRIIAQVSDMVDLIPFASPMDYNIVDLAWLRPINGVVIDHSIGCQGNEPMGEIDFEILFDENDKNPEVFLCSADYESKKGELIGIPVVMFYEYENTKYQFQDALMINIGKEGDSGALLCSKNYEIGGMFFAVGYDTSNKRKVGFANTWENVKTTSGYEFIY